MTYRFVREVVKFWDIPLIVLQVDINPELGQANGYTVWEPKDIQTNMPALKPFIDMVKKYGTPYIGGAFQTHCVNITGRWKKWSGREFGGSAEMTTGLCIRQELCKQQIYTATEVTDEQQRSIESDSAGRYSGAVVCDGG